MTNRIEDREHCARGEQRLRLGSRYADRRSLPLGGLGHADRRPAGGDAHHAPGANRDRSSGGRRCFRRHGDGDASAIVAALPVAEQIGKCFWDTPSTLPDEARWQALRLNFERRELFRHFEDSRRMRGGNEGHHVLSGEPRFDHGGRFLGYRGFSRDVTDRVFSARRAREAYDRLRTAIENLDEVVALTDAEDRFVMVNRPFLRMSGAIAQFAGPGWTYEQYCARESPPAISSTRSGAKRRGSRDAWSCAAKRASRWNCSSRAADLIGNALKYSRTRDTARVEIGWDAQRQAYFVRDNGVGFDTQYAAKLFGAFERLHGESEFEGSGIGLAIVQRILERHGAKIWADAVPDRGATF